MSMYRVRLVRTASAVFDVEADDEDQAIEAAFEQAPAGLCHQCAQTVELAGEWALPELHPLFNKPEDDVEKVSPR